MELKGVESRHLQTVCSILRQYLPDYQVKAFGSRVNGGKVRTFSDLDLAVITERPLDALLLADLKEALSESDLPFKVDLIDWAVTSERFRGIVERSSLVIQEGTKEGTTKAPR